VVQRRWSTSDGAGYGILLLRKADAQLLDVFGGQGRNRTTDTRIFSPLLYQLSYLAVRGALQEGANYTLRYTSPGARKSSSAFTRRR
jgi:hypothetical protein